MLAKVKQTFQKNLIEFALTLSLALSVFQFQLNASPSTLGSEFANAFTPEAFSVAYISVDPEPFPHHPPN